MRPDLADVRLAGQVFAPHYAAPMDRVLARATALSAVRTLDGEPLATLAAGDRFEVLEIAGEHAWGVAPGCGLVGYVDQAALAPE